MIYVYDVSSRNELGIMWGRTDKIDQRVKQHKTSAPLAKLLTVIPDCGDSKMERQIEWCFTVKFGEENIIEGTKESARVFSEDVFEEIANIKTARQLKDYLDFQGTTKKSIQYYMDKSNNELAPQSTRYRDLARARHFQAMLALDMVTD